MTEIDKSLLEQEVLARETEIFNAIKAKDSAQLANYITDDFIYRTYPNGTQTRAEFLRAVSALPVEILSLELTDLKADIFGEMAVLTGNQQAHVRMPDGKEIRATTAFTDIFLKRDGQWLLALAHAVDIIQP